MEYSQITNLIPSKDFLNQFLAARGIYNLREYLDPPKTCLNNFLLLDNIITGAQCLKEHISQKHQIFIQVDSDCDGICSAAMVYLYIKHIDPETNVIWRMHEGKQHGIILDTVPNGTKLVIAPDSSSNDYEVHEQLNAEGIDVLVLDHHLADNGYSENAIVINNQLSENYPNKSLCGGAVVYKFCCCLDSLYEDNFADTLIDLAAVSLIGDMMLVNDLETRYIIKHGLNNISNLGLTTFIEKQSFSMGNKISPIGIAFYIVPLINAIIRVGTQEEKNILFTAFIDPLKIIPSTKRGHKPGDTETVCAQAARICTNAKNRQDRARLKALESIDFEIQKEGLDTHKILFVNVGEDEDFDTTLTGLIAMGIASKYKKPTCIGRLCKDGTIKGSIRGLANCPIKDFRQFLLDSELFEYVTGHAGAAGFSIMANNVDNLLEYADTKLKDVDFNENVYEVDLIIDANDPNLEQIIYDLGQLSDIWGQGLPEPLIAIENVNLSKQDINLIGADSSTLKFEHNGITFIKFKDNKAIEDFTKSLTMTVTVLGKPNLNSWMGNVTPQILIENYELVDTTYSF